MNLFALEFIRESLVLASCTCLRRLDLGGRGTTGPVTPVAMAMGASIGGVVGMVCWAEHKKYKYHFSSTIFA